MKTKITILLVSALIAFQSNSQTPKEIAVANPSVSQLYATPEICAKLLRYELGKIDSYAVYDEFEMNVAYDKDSSFQTNCHHKQCLIDLGKAIKVDLIATGNFDRLGDKIIITLKIINVNDGQIISSKTREFDNQEKEMQRMVEIIVKEMHGIDVDKELIDRLKFNNELILTDNVGKVNNSGPRIGYGFMLGSYGEFATRPESQGGLDIFPGVSMIGYQAEIQYVGTENFSALFEFVANIAGLDQGVFIPSVSVLNGMRFGKKGWEIAFGPGFGIAKVSKGFFDTQGLIGDEGNYINQEDWNAYLFSLPTEERPTSPEELYSEYNFDSKYGDTRGHTIISTNFVFAFGRTFKAGALNIPVNAFYSARKGGGLAGVSVGFNVMKRKENIHPTM